MNYLVGYGAPDQQPAGILDRIKSWWAGMSTTEKVLYGAAGGVALIAGAALVVGGPKKTYAANGSRKRKRARANAAKKDKRSTAEARLRRLRIQTDEAIDQAFQLMRRAHGMGAHAPSIQHALNELALAKQANFRGDDITARQMIESALARVGMTMELPHLQARRQPTYVTVDALSASGKPIKRKRMALLAQDVGEYISPDVKAAAMESGRLRGEMSSLDRAIRTSLEQGRAEWSNLEAGIERALASGREDAALELIALREKKAKARESDITWMIEEHQRVGSRARELGSMIPNAAVLSRAERIQMTKTAEGRAELARLREAAKLEAAELEPALSDVERRRTEERFASMAGRAVDVATSLAAQRELEQAAQRRAETEAVLEGRYTRLKGGTVVGQGEKQRRAPAVAGERGSRKIRTKGGGAKAVVRAAQIAGTAEEFGAVTPGAGVHTEYGARRTTKYPTVRPVYGELIKGGSRAYKLVQKFVPGGEIMAQAKGESISDFKRRALDAGFTPLGPDEPVEGEKKKPRIAISPMGWRLLSVATAEDPDIFEEPRALRRARVPVSRTAPPEIVGFVPSVEGLRTVMSASKRPADWRNISYSVQRGDVPVLALPSLLRRAERGGAPKWVVREIRDAIEYYKKHPEPLMSRYPSGTTRSRREITGYEPVSPEEAFTATDQERLGVEAGYNEGMQMDPHSGRALAIQQSKFSREREPYAWGYQRGLRKAMMEKQWFGSEFAPRASTEAEREYKRYPRGFQMAPEAYEGSGTRFARAIPGQSKVLFKSNSRRRAKRGRRAA